MVRKGFLAKKKKKKRLERGSKINNNKPHCIGVTIYVCEYTVVSVTRIMITVRNTVRALATYHALFQGFYLFELYVFSNNLMQVNLVKMM